MKGNPAMAGAMKITEVVALLGIRKGIHNLTLFVHLFHTKL